MTLVDRYHPAMPFATRHGLRGLSESGYRVSIDDYSYGVPSVHWMLREKEQYQLTIGKFCSIAAGVTIYVGSQGRHELGHLSTYPIGMIFGGPAPQRTLRDLSVRIGSDVWIGREAMIHAGVEIGHGAVIGTRALVTRSIPPYAVAYGVPARVGRFRFTETQIERLLALRWWDLPEEALRAKSALFACPEIDRVLDEMEEIGQP